MAKQGNTANAARKDTDHEDGRKPIGTLADAKKAMVSIASKGGAPSQGGAPSSRSLSVVIGPSGKIESKPELLESYLVDLDSIMRQLKDTFDSSSDGPDAYNIYAYTALLGKVTEVLHSLEKLNKGKLVGLIEKVVQNSASELLTGVLMSAKELKKASVRDIDYKVESHIEFVVTQFKTSMQKMLLDIEDAVKRGEKSKR